MDKLDKVVYNLLSNAAKYTPEGGTIVVSQAHDEEKRTFKLSVNNPGELIPKRNWIICSRDSMKGSIVNSIP